MVAVARPRNPIRNKGNPLGDFAQLLCAKLESDFRKYPGEDVQDVRDRFVDALAKHGHKVSSETVRKWERGELFPKPNKLDNVARALGFADWIDMVANCRRFRR